MKRNRRIVGVSTQGRPTRTYSQWVTTFKVEYRKDAHGTFETIENGRNEPVVSQSDVASIVKTCIYTHTTVNNRKQQSSWKISLSILQNNKLFQVYCFLEVYETP